MPLECKSHACQVLPTAILTVKHTLQATHSLVPRSTCQYKITDDNKIPYYIKHVVTKMYRHPFYLLPVYSEALPLLIRSTDKTPLVLRVGELVTHCHRKTAPWRMMTPQKLDKHWVSEELLLNQIHTVRLLFLVVQQWCIPAHAPAYSFSKQTLFIALTLRNIPKYIFLVQSLCAYSVPMSLHRPIHHCCTTTPKYLKWKATSNRLQLC